MQANYVQRLRLSFSKVGPTRFIGHLDLARTLERSLNRARIPMAYTQGFNQRPRLQLVGALPLGFTSDCELADIWLKEKIDPQQAREQLMARIAPGIVIHSAIEVPLSAPVLQTVTQSAWYLATLLEPFDQPVLQQRIDALLAAESLPRERRQKTYDLRPLILELALTRPEKTAADSQPALRMHLLLLPGQTGRPDEVLAALALDPLAARIHRTEIILADETGETER